MNLLAGKGAVVTGAGTGIGRAIAVRFAVEGASVALLGRRREKLDETLALLKPDQHAEHLAIPTDVSDEGQVGRARKLVEAAWGHVDVLVSNAGVVQPSDPITAPLEDWMIPINVILMGAVHCCRAFVPIMPDGGRIVNVTSIHRERVERGASSYATAKGALSQYTKSLALELASRNIMVNTVAPGFIDTPMSTGPDGVSELETERFRRNYVEGHHLPLKRAGRPEEVAGVVAFLAGPDATYLTGETITVDGGLTITF